MIYAGIKKIDNNKYYIAMNTFKVNTLIIILILIGGLFSQCTNKLYKTGMEFYDSGNYNDAVAQFSKWIEEDTDNSKAYVARANAYKKLDKKRKAAEDYQRAGMFKKDPELFMKAANLYMEIEDFENASKMARRTIELEDDYIKAYKLDIKALIELEKYSEAYENSKRLTELEENGPNYYWQGFVAEKLDKNEEAENDFRKALGYMPDDMSTHIALSQVLLKTGQYDKALKACDEALAVDAKNKDVLLIRSKVYKQKLEYPKAINDLSKILLFSPDDQDIFFRRGLYYQEFNQNMNALNDFSKVISLDPQNANAYYFRGKSHEEVTNYKKAINDYEKFIQLAAKDTLVQDKIAEVKDRLYELKKEDNAPEIAFADSINREGKTLIIPGDAEKIFLSGTIIDENDLKTFKIGDQDIDYQTKEDKIVFAAKVPLNDKNGITVLVQDVYDNTRELYYPVKKTEITPPEIKLITPYASDDGEIYLQNDNSKLYVEGKIEDKSLIKDIYIEDKVASYSERIQNPQFSATIDISNKNEITVKAIDIHGNTKTRQFKFNREGVNIAKDNPMGKTWVVFIENSDYETFASLDGPVKDVSEIKSVLANYRIHNFIHKKNLTKRELEKFFSIELRDLVRANKVNSLLIWYAGHGKFINETGYWVPVNADRDDEFSFFNINNLKSSLQAYSKLVTHTLVVTDACESGPSFYQAMRSIQKKRDCSNWRDTQAKSAQVLSSAGYELAVDQSQFTKSFANTLANNPNACLPIEDIVSKVTVAVSKAGRQKPQFGKIAGLEDEGGTFFFISKEK